VSVRWCHAIGEMLFLCSAKSRFFVPEYRSTCKEDGTLQKITCIASAEPRGPARRRQVAEAVGSSLQLTPRWREHGFEFPVPRQRRHPSATAG